MHKLLKAIVVISSAMLFLTIRCGESLNNPYEDHTIALVVENSQKIIRTAALSDTVGDTIRAGIILKSPSNIDSIEITSLISDSLISMTKFFDIKTLKFGDTLWESVYLSNIGAISIIGKAFLQTGKTISCSTTVFVYSRQPNSKPDLIINGKRTILPGQICTLMVTASDPEISQVHSYATLTKPVGASFDPQTRIFIWKSPDDFIGIDSVVFKVEDNGRPPLADIKTAYIYVRTTITNTPPVLEISGKRNIKTNDTCTLIIRAVSTDAYQKVFISQLWGPPGSGFKDSVFRWVPPVGFTGRDSARFSAIQDGLAPLPDSQTVYINVSQTIQTPPRPDSLKIVRVKDGKLTLSWLGSFVADNYTVFRAELSRGKTFIAIDTVFDYIFIDSIGASDYSYFITANNSAGSSLPSDTVRNSADHRPPTLYFRSPAKDTVVGADSCLLTVVCRDTSGIGWLIGLRDTAAFILKKSAASDSIWTATVKGLLPGRYSLITLIAADSSAAKNKDTADVRIKYDGDTLKPSVSLVVPGADSAITNSSSYTVVLKCTDASGVASVNGVLGTGSFIGAKDSDSTWKIAVTGLAANAFSTVAFTATDSSLRANKTVITLHLKYKPILKDTLAPVLYFVSPSRDTGIGVDSCTVQVVCKDPSDIASLIGMRDTVPFLLSKSGATDSLWTGTAKGLAAMQYSTVTLIATDASTAMNKDTVKLRVKYDNDLAAPVIAKVTPASDSASTSSSSYTVTLQCTDASGVTSVTGLIGTTSFAGTRSTGNLWTIALSGLAADAFTTVVFTAIDSSLQSNWATLTLHIKNDPTLNDADGPIINQISGPLTGAMIADPFVSIVDSIADTSGVDSVFWTLNKGTIKLLAPVGGKPGNYSLTDSVKRENLDTLVITAIDKSTKRNRSVQTIVLNYIIPPRITGQPASQSVCAGSARAIFSIAATGTAPLRYQWRTGAASFTNIIGAITPQCTLSAPLATTILSCTVGNGSSAGAASNLCTLTVGAALTIGNTLASQSVCASSSSITYGITASGGTGTLHYLWFKNGSTSLGTDISANGVSYIYVVQSASNTGSYYCVVTDSLGCSVTSNTATLTVNTPSVAPTSIIATPAVACEGSPVVLHISGGALGTNSSWKWYTNGCGAFLRGSDSTFPIAASSNTTYYVRAEGGCGPSSCIQYTVAPSPAITTTQLPSTLTRCYYASTAASLSFTASGGTGTLTYQWYMNGSTIGDGLVFDGTQSNALSLKMYEAPSQGGTYYCIVTDGAGCTATTNSTVVTVTSSCP